MHRYGAQGRLEIETGTVDRHSVRSLMVGAAAARSRARELMNSPLYSSIVPLAFEYINLPFPHRTAPHREKRQSAAPISISHFFLSGAAAAAAAAVVVTFSGGPRFSVITISRSLVFAFSRRVNFHGRAATRVVFILSPLCSVFAEFLAVTISLRLNAFWIIDPSISLLLVFGARSRDSIVTVTKVQMCVRTEEVKLAPREMAGNTFIVDFSSSESSSRSHLFELSSVESTFSPRRARRRRAHQREETDSFSSFFFVFFRLEATHRSFVRSSASFD